MQDILFALRSLRKRPAFTILILSMIALGIGANTAIFSIVNSVLLRPLPLKDPNRLAVIGSSNVRIDVPSKTVSFDDWADFRQQNTAFENIAATTVQEPYSFNYGRCGTDLRTVGVGRLLLDSGYRSCCRTYVHTRRGPRWRGCGCRARFWLCTPTIRIRSSITRTDASA